MKGSEKIMKGYIYMVVVLALGLLAACGNTQLEHCTNAYDPVEKGNVDSMNQQQGEVVSEIPSAGAGQEAMREAENDTTKNGPAPSEVDENGELVGADESLEQGQQLVNEEEEVNRRTSEAAQREAEERQRRALEEMGM